jgi:predicted TPR repeat methyltransferase
MANPFFYCTIRVDSMNAFTDPSKAQRHDAYAADYDQQVTAYGCHLADVLFGLCYEYLQTNQRVLEAGIGSGLAVVNFARAGLVVEGFDFSPAMLEICRAKNITSDLKLHDIQEEPWPYPAAAFDVLVCCGVLHFIRDLPVVFREAQRILQSGGVFAFTTKTPTPSQAGQPELLRQVVDGFEIYSHAGDYLEQLLAEYGFERCKFQSCLGGGELFHLWVAIKTG